MQQTRFALKHEQHKKAASDGGFFVLVSAGTRYKGRVDAPLTNREKLIITGLYLSKFDHVALDSLGFESFTEAFNVLAFALGARPASIKNYRDEFDPRSSNGRKGWHRRKMRDYCIQIYEKYNHLDLETFTGLVSSFVGYDSNAGSSLSTTEDQTLQCSSFAQRLITGRAAEKYFTEIHPTLPEFQGYTLEDTTQLGCGYDFLLRTQPRDEQFLAIEVKGLRESSGTLSLTPKEYNEASSLRGRFCLFVVSNFRESPTHRFYRNPLEAGLSFSRIERTIIQTSWTVRV